MPRQLCRAERMKSGVFNGSFDRRPPAWTRSARLRSRWPKTLRVFNDGRLSLAARIELMGIEPDRASWRRRLAATVVCVTAFFAATTLASKSHLSSAPADKITVDGLVDEWPQLEPLEETHLSAAVQNDGRSVYLMIATSDQARRRQLMTAGLIVWFDADGGRKRAFGVRIPGVLAGFGGFGRGGPGSRRVDPPPDTGDGRRLPPFTYVEIVGPGQDDRRRVELAAMRSLQVARSQAAGTLTIELQVPLQPNDASEYAIGARAGSLIGLGFETPKIERPEGPPPNAHGGGGGRPGGMGGHGGRGGGGGMGAGRGGPPPGGHGPDGQFERAAPLKYWTTVQLDTPRT